jgi:hypothetical protein
MISPKSEDVNRSAEKISARIAVPPFLAWRQRLGLSRPEAARLLGRTERQLQTYDRALELPQLVLLAMTAIEYLPAWRLRDLGIEPTWRARR